MKKIFIFLLFSSFLTSFGYQEKCVGPLDPNARYKIEVPFTDKKYDYSYDKFDAEGKKYTCFVKIKDAYDAVDFVAAQPDKQRFQWLKSYLKTQLPSKQMKRSPAF